MFYSLGCKVFPTISGKDFDRLFKCLFYQALLVKWQQRLGCPKPEEGFHDLLSRARMLEKHEKQFTASAQNRTEARRRPAEGSRKQPAKLSGRRALPVTSKAPEKTPEVGSPPIQARCYKCKQMGHMC